MSINRGYFYLAPMWMCLTQSSFYLYLSIHYIMTLKKKESSQQSDTQWESLRVTLKYNATCSAICPLSSTTLLFIMALAELSEGIGYYLWLLGDADNMINCICAFLMVGANRRYVTYITSKGTTTNDIDGDTSTGQTKTVEMDPGPDDDEMFESFGRLNTLR
eukprot:1128450_1